MTTRRHRQVECPPLSQQLIDYLYAVFPDRAVNPDEKNPWRAYGNAEVIKHLEAVMAIQDEEPNVPT